MKAYFSVLGGNLGIVQMHLQISVLQCQDETKGPLAYQALQLVKLQASPHVIYASSQIDNILLEALRRPIMPASDDCEPVNTADSSIRLPAQLPQRAAAAHDSQSDYTVKLEKASAFHYDKVCDCLPLALL